jgi:hypothetical protein
MLVEQVSGVERRDPGFLFATHVGRQPQALDLLLRPASEAAITFDNSRDPETPSTKATFGFWDTIVGRLVCRHDRFILAFVKGFPAGSALHSPVVWDFEALSRS